MGVLNLTPDSFFEGSRASTLAQAKSSVESMIADGADIIDIGAESTRPGATLVSVEAECERLFPILDWLAHQSIPFSVDTRKTAVMQAVLPFKPVMINDVNALQAPGALEVLADHPVEVCLMHAKGDPETMQDNPVYTDVVAEVYAFFQDRIAACEAGGIDKRRIWVDPGFGFGKTLTHNLKMLQSLHVFTGLGCRLMVGMSRKRMIGAILNKPVDERLYGSLAAHTVALLQGANMVRTHDVAATKDAVNILQAIYGT